MKATKFNRFLSILLVTVMVVSMMPLNAISADLDFDGINSLFDDLVWGLVKESINPTVSAEGLPEGAEAELDVVSDPFAVKTRGAKSGSSQPAGFGEFLDFYDIKAVDKETGEELHPQGEVTVSIKNARIKEDQSVYLIHVLDNENVIKNAENLTIVTDSAFVRAFPEAAAATEAAIGVSGAVAVELINEIDQKGRDLTFKTSSFSIFAIVDNPILIVNFYKGEKSDTNPETNKIVSIRVKLADISDEDEFERLIYDPGVNETLPDNVLFRGWFESFDYTVEDAEYYDEASNSTMTNALTIAQVREKIAEKLRSGFNNNDELDFFAMLYVQYTITYFDEDGNVCLGRDFALQKYNEAESEVDYQVTLNYAPYGQFENFEGWMLRSDDPESGSTFYNTAKQNLVGIYPGGDDNGPSGTLQTQTINGVDVHDYVYVTPTWTRIKGDIYLYANSPEGRWLVFDENGKGGKYIAPQFVKTNDNTINPNTATNTDLGYPVTMTRYGYSFSGWYYFPEGVEVPAPDSKGSRDLTNALPFTFGSTLSENTRIYAKWTPNTTANYTIIFWTQNVERNGYHVEDSLVVENGTVGQNIPYSSYDNDDEDYAYQSNGNGRFGENTGTNSLISNGTVRQIQGHYLGFCLTEASKNQQVKITPEGDAVLNLYYDRIEYNFKFYLYRQSGSMVTTYVYNVSTNDNDNDPEKYGDVNGQKARVYWRNGAFRTSNNNNGTVYNGTVYTRTSTQVYASDYPNNSGTGSDLNGLVTWHTNQDEHPGVNGYTIQSETVGNYVYYYFTISAYYGEDISSKWPTYDKITGANGHEAVSYVMMVGTKLKPQATNQGSGTVKGIITVMNENILGATNNANGNYVMVRFPDSYYNWRYHIWFETMEGEDYTGKTLHTQTINGETRTYYEETVLVVRSSNTTDGNQNEPKYQGFDYVTRLGWNNNQTTWQGGHWTTTENNTTLYHLNYVYNRQQYKISYLDGQYVDGNGNGLQSKAGQPLHSSPDIGYRSTISDEYKNYVPDLPEGESGYVFEGWYVDEGCTTPYTWSTMPEGGIEVYAKWRQIQYRVILHPNAGSATATVNGTTTDTRDMSLDWGSESQAMNFRVSYGGTVSVPTGTRTAYYFGGWYTDAALTKSFIPAVELNEQTVTSAYNKETDLTDDMDKWGDLHAKGDHTEPWNSDAIGNNGGDRFWITKKLDLYAKWRKKIVGAEGLYLKYVTTDDEGRVGSFDNGATEYCDGFLYADGAFAYGQAACDAPTVAQGEDELHFRYWVVQRWDASTNTFFDAKDANNNLIIIYPGERFETDIEYAEQVPIPTDDPEYVAGTNIYRYYMVLRAEYSPAVPRETTLVYDANGGSFTSTPTGYTAGTTSDGYATISKTLLVNEVFDIQPGTIVTREGYTFKGWSLERNSDVWLQGGETNYAADNLPADPEGNDPSNTLYAVWDITMVPVQIQKGWAVEGDQALAGSDTFTVNLTLDANDVDVMGHGIENEDGTAATLPLTLDAAGTAQTVYIPYGTKLTATETGYNTDKYKAPQYENNGQAWTGTHDTVAGTITVKNEIRTYNVTVVKAVTNTFAAGTTFDFTSTNLGADTFSLGLAADTDPANSRVFENIKYGTVITVAETPSTLEFTSDTPVVSGAYTQDGDNITVQGDVTVTFTNTAKFYTVTITKELVNRGVDDATWNTVTFPISYTVYDKNGTQVATGTANLAKDGTTTVTGVPFGGYVVVEEGATASNGTTISSLFDVTYTNNSTAVSNSNANEDGTTSIVITVTNTRKTGSIIIEKIIKNERAAEVYADRNFTFTADFGSWTKQIATTTAIADRTILEVPYGLEVTITESADSLFTTTNDHGTDNVAKVTLSSESETVKFTNTRKDVSLTVKKTVNESVDNNKPFYFDVKVGDETREQLQVNAGSTNTITNIPFGATVVVSEDMTKTYENGHTVSEIFEPVASQTAEDIQDDNGVLTFANKRKTATITITKEIQNAAAATEYATRPFYITSGQWSGNQTITTSQPHEFTVPYGTTVTVTETPDDLFDTTYKIGTTTGDDNVATVTPYEPSTTITFVNTRKPVTVKVVKELDNKGVDSATWNEFGFPMTYNVDGGEDKTLEVVQGTNGNTITVPFGSVITLSEDAAKDNVNIAAQFDVEYYEGSEKVESVEVTANDSTPVIKVKNIRKTFTVTVTKTVTIEESGVAFDPARDAFTFTPTLTNATYTLPEATFELSNNGSKSYTKVIPYGAKFSVKETENALYDTSATANGESYTDETVLTITDDTTIAYTNVRKVAEVTIEKDFESKVPADSPRTFKFDYTYTDGSVTTTSATTTVTVTLTNGTGSGKSAAIKAPVGATFTATEHEYDELTGDSGKSKSETVAENGNTIVFTNKREVIDLTIDKTVVSDVTADLNGDYFFNVYYQYVVDGVTKTFSESVKVPVTNGHGTAVVYSIPKDATGLKITELTDQGLIETTKDYITTTGNGVTGATGSFNGTDRSYAISSITDNVTAKFVNTRDTVQVTVTKKVENAAAAALKENFGFTVSGTGYQFTIDGNKTSSATFDLKHNGSQTITVPKGVDFVIEETANENYTTEITGATSTDGLIATVATTAAGPYNVVYTNTRKPVSLTVKKVIAGETADKDNGQTFYFNVTVNGTALSEQIAVVAGDETGTVINDIPFGATVVVSEDMTRTYENGKTVGDIFKTVADQMASNIQNNNGVLTFTNERKTATIIIEKVIENEAAAADYADTIFNFTSNRWNGNKGISTQTAKADRTITVPYGTKVTIEEVENTLFTTVNTSPVSGDTTGRKAELTPYADETTVTFTNTRKPVTVTVTKTMADGDAAYVNDNETFAFTMTGQDGFSLAVNGTETFTLDYGTTFTLTEKDLNTAKYGIAKFDGTAAATAISESYSKTYTVKDNTDITVENNVLKYTVTLVKQVTVPEAYADVSADTSHQFTVAVESDNTSFSVANKTISVGNNAKIENVPYGVTLTLTEQSDYRYEYKSGNGDYTITGDQTVTFTNERKFINVSVTKILVSNVEADWSRPYTFVYSYTDGTASRPAPASGADVTIRVTETSEGDYRGTDSTTIVVPVGANVTVKETNVEGFTTDNVEKTQNNVTTDPNFEFTNKRDVVDITIEKVVNSTVEKDLKGVYSFSYTYKYVDGSSVVTVGPKTVTIDLSGENASSTALIQNVPKNAYDLVITELTTTGTTLNETAAFVTTSGTISGAAGTFVPADRQCTISGINSDATTVTVTFTNKRETVDVTVEKVVKNAAAAALSEGFEFTVSGTGYTYSYKEGVAGTAGENGYTFSLANGQSTTFTVPRGVDFVVKETADNNYTTAITGATSTNGLTATVTTDATTGSYTVTYTNTRKPVTVTVTKELLGLEGITVANDANEEFTITIGYTDKNGQAQSVDAVLKSGESTTVEVEYGTNVTVSETPDSKYFIAATGTGTYENIIAAKEITVKNQRDTVEIDVTKIVTNAQAAIDYKDVEFGFEMTVTGATITGGSFDLKHNATSNKIKVPKGFAVTVTETIPDDYKTLFTTTSTVSGTNGTGTGLTATLTADANKNITFTNDRKQVTVTVKKTIANGDADYVGNDTFAFTMTGQDGFSLAVDGTKTFTLDYGTTFTLTEKDLNTAKYGIAKFDGEAAATAISASYSKEYTVKDNTVITVENNVLKYTVTVQKVVTVPTAYADIAADTSHSFTITQSGLGEGTLTISKTAPATVQKIPYGTVVKLAETEDYRYELKSVTVNGDNYEEDTAYTVVGDTTFVFTNERKFVNVTVTKKLDSKLPSDLERDYTFEYSYTDGSASGSGDLTINVSETTYTGSDNSIYVPVGANITVSETNYAGFETNPETPTKSKDNVTEDPKFEFTNKRDVVDVTIVKVVNSTVDADKNGKYQFTYTYKYMDGTEKTVNETKTIDLSGENTTILIQNVPKNAYGFAISELETEALAATAAFVTTTGQIEGATGTFGTRQYTGIEINSDATKVTVTFTNTRETVDVTIKKVVENAAAAAEQDPFTFTVTADGYEFVIGGEQKSTATFQLKHGESNKVTVPRGVVLSVAETADEDYTTTITGATSASGLTATVSTDASTGSYTVTYTNKRNPLTFTIKKVLDNLGMDDGWVSNDFTGFPIKYTITDGNNDPVTETVNVKGGATSASITIPYGAKLEIEEIVSSTYGGLQISDYFDTTYDDNKTISSYTKDYDKTVIVVTNTRLTVPVTVTKVVDSRVSADENATYKFKVSTNSTTYPSQNVEIVGSGSATKDTENAALLVPKGADVTVTETNADTAAFRVEYLDGEYKAGTAQTIENVLAATEFKFKNTRNEFKLQIIKTVNNFAGSGDNVYPVTYTITYGEEKAPVADTYTDTLELKAGGMVDNIMVPYGCDVEISENTDATVTINGNDYAIKDAFTTTIGGGSNNPYTVEAMTADTAVEVVNTRIDQTVTVHKIVNNVWGIETDKTASFTITVNGTEETYTVANNVASKEYTVPYGESFTATETADSAFDTKVGFASNSLMIGNTETITAVHKDSVHDIWFENTRKSVVVTVVKKVVSNDPNDQRTKEFHFNAAFTFGDQDLNSFLVSANDKNFALKNGDSNDITVCYGATLNVQELLTYMDGSGTTIDDSKKYAVTITVGDETVTATEYTINSVESATTITFTNERKAGDLTITKTVTGKTTSDAFVFKITKVVVEGDEPFEPLYVTIHPETDKDGNGFGSVTIKQLEAGTYIVEELDNWSWAYLPVGEKQKSETIVGGDQKTVNFGNKDKDTNWLRDESSRENNFEDVTPTVSAEKGTAAMAWDSKFWLAYAASAGRFGDDKEIA